MTEAWVTLLSRPGYLPGVRTLWRSLQAHGTTRPLVVLVTDGVDEAVRATLRSDGCQVREVEKLEPPAGAGNGYAFERFAEVWTKLRAWELVDLDRVVLLDADMLAVAPMDELFTMPLPEHGVAACHTCRCNPERHDGYPADWVPANCYYTYTRADGTDDLPAGFAGYFNAGLVVLRPHADAFAALVARVAAITDLAAYPFPEQDLLNEAYRGRWGALPYGYNALKTIAVQHPRTWDLADVKNVHYLLGKPWDPPQPDEPAVYGELRQLWADVASR